VRALIAEGYRDIRDIPQDRLTSENHLRVWRATLSGLAEFDRRAAARELREFGYPRFFLDFETASFAVPIWVGTRPYQALPFQYSCHVQTQDGSTQWRGFIDLSGQPPMGHFLDSVLECLGTAGPIFAWNAGFESDRLRDMAKLYPAKAEAISKVVARIVDLLPIAREHYYHPKMMGSWSLKAVLPTIDTKLGYEDVGEVQDGNAASSAYLEAIAPGTSPTRKASLSESLTKYCRRDTEALVRIASYFESGS
jgi:hypothetical protein